MANFKLPTFMRPRLAQHRRFYYKPRYYNERRESLKKRAERISAELANQQVLDGDAPLKPRMNMETGWISKHRRYEQRKSNGILMVTIAVLSLAVYLIFFVS